MNHMNEMIERITRHPCFREMAPEQKCILTEGAKEARFEPGEVLFRMGEPANAFYLIENGSIALEVHDASQTTRLIQKVNAGEVLGWSWLFPPFTWHFTARALEPTTVIVLSGAHLLVAAERDHEFGFELMKRIAQIVIQRLQATRKCLLTSMRDEASAKPVES
ncbi:MAG: cyclic nucleotide-binding domain-containing protein [Verrucomicrobiota bacterium]